MSAFSLNEYNPTWVLWVFITSLLVSSSLSAQYFYEPDRNFVLVHEQKPLRIETFMLNQKNTKYGLLYTQGIGIRPSSAINATIGKIGSKNSLWLTWQERIWTRTTQGKLEFGQFEMGIQNSSLLMSLLLKQQRITNEYGAQAILSLRHNQQISTLKVFFLEKIYPYILPQHSYYSVLFGGVELCFQKWKTRHSDSTTAILSPGLRWSQKGLSWSISYLIPIAQRTHHASRIFSGWSISIAAGF